MYTDQDGIATERSQAMYNSRMRILLSTTSLLSWAGFAFAILNGEFTRENLRLTLSSLNQTDLLHLSKFLWESYI